MPTDIFNNAADNYPKITGGIKFKSNAVLAFSQGGQNYRGMVIQNYQIGYTQVVTKLKGLNTPDIVAVVAPPNGTLNIQSSVVNSTDYYQFIQDFGDVCKVSASRLQLANTNTEACSADFKAPSLTMTGCLCSGVQLSQTIENLVLASTLSLEFTALEKNT